MRRRDPDMLLAPWMLNCKQPERSAYWTSLSFLWLRSLRGYSGPGCNFDAEVAGSGFRSETQRGVHEFTRLCCRLQAKPQALRHGMRKWAVIRAT